MRYDKLARLAAVSSHIFKHGTVPQKQVDALGFRAEDNGTIIGIRTSTDVAYFRRDGAPLLIQVPHLQTESFVGVVGEGLFKATNASGLWMSHIPRRVLDPAHEYNCDMTALTMGAATACKRMLFVSLHGFAATKNLKGTSAIVSGGEWWPNTPALKLEEALRKIPSLRRGVKLFPFDVHRLGGTTNAQGRVLRSLGLLDNFIHLELSLEYRKVLRYNPSSLAALASALVEAAEGHTSVRWRRIQDPWHQSIGLLARNAMDGRDIVAASLRLSTEEFVAKYGEPPDPKAIAEDLGVSVAEVNYYLKEV